VLSYVKPDSPFTIPDVPVAVKTLLLTLLRTSPYPLVPDVPFAPRTTPPYNFKTQVIVGAGF
jgi:hypothetical protein